jgi:PAS domain S-box-containing protein
VAIAACTYWLSKESRQVYFIGAFGTFVLIVGYILAVTVQEPPDQITFLVNRISALLVIWFAGFFTIKYQRVQKDKINQREEIERRKLAEERFRSSQEMHEAIARNFPTGWIGLLTEDLVYLFADGKGLARIGMKTADIVGRKFTETVTGDRIEQHLREAQDGKRSTFEAVINKRTFEINASHFQGKQKERWVLIVTHDITTQKETEKRLINALENERELHDLKSRFITMASHEFRTPLATIMSSASLLGNYSGDKYELAKKNHVARIKRSVKLLSEVLDDFLSLGRLEEGKVTPWLKPICISDLLNELVDEAGSLKHDDQKLVAKNFFDDKIISDKSVLKIILHNLLSNAFKYSTPNDVVAIEAHLEDSRCIVSVTDHGMGILPEDQDHVFESFFRGQNATNIQGTGLGLCIARKYAKLLGGDIAFSSIPDKETVFTLSIPQIGTDAGSSMSSGKLVLS